MKQHPREKRPNGGGNRSEGGQSPRENGENQQNKQQRAEDAQRKSNRRLIAGIFTSAIVVAVLIAFGVYAVISNSPESLLRLAMFNAVKDKAAAANVELSDGGNRPPLAGNVAFAVDQVNNRNWRAAIDTNTNDAQLNVETLILNREIFIKGNGTNPEEVLRNNGWITINTEQLHGKLNGQWYRITENDVRALADMLNLHHPIAIPSSSDIGRVAEIYTQHQFIKPDRIFDDEIIDGVNTAHFTLKRDNGQFVAFLEAVKAANLQTIKVTDSDINWARNNSSEALIPNSTVEVWIGRDNKKLKQMRVTSVTDGREFITKATLENNPPNLGNYSEPSDAKPVSEIIMSALGPSFSPAGYNAGQSDGHAQPE